MAGIPHKFLMAKILIIAGKAGTKEFSSESFRFRFFKEKL